MPRDEPSPSQQSEIDPLDAARPSIIAEMSPEETEEEGQITDEIVQRIDRDWDMSAVPFSFYLRGRADIRAKRIASERAALAATLEGDPAEHRATWEALSAALAERQARPDNERASG